MDPTEPYPMWVMYCEACRRGTATVYEKPGTGCAYVRHCIVCGGTRVKSIRVENTTQHEKAMKEGEV